MKSSARGPMALLAAMLLTSAGGCGAGAGEPDPAQDPDTTSALAAETAVLGALVELAGGSDFYLVLDAKAGTLRLMLRGAALREYTLESVQVGLPRVAFARRSATRPWYGVVWSGGALDPDRTLERVELVVPTPGSEVAATEPAIPPTPEEAYPAPLRYHLVFPGGPSLEVRPLDADEDAGLWSRFAAGWVSYWGDFWAAFAADPDERVRVRLTLSPEDAGSLYRALPPNVSLIVI